MEGFKNFFTSETVISMYLHHPDKNMSEIANLTHKSIGEIYRILHSYKVSPNRLKVNHNNVYEFASSGMSVTQIAELTGYTPRNVRYILRKK